MRAQKDFYKVVNIAEDGEITMLDYVFSDGNIRGAVGTTFYPVTEEDIQDRISEYENNDTELLIYFAENFGNLDRYIIENIDSSREALIDLFFDQSYSEKWDYLREVIKKTDSEVILFECSGGGRCFDKNFRGNVNTELSEIIREYES